MFVMPPDLADALLPRYRLDSLIAEGGQACVMRARDLTVGRDVALKLLPRGGASAVAVERFLREIRLLADLSHPFILPILDAGESAGVLWYAMPLLRGETLAERLRRGPTSVVETRRWGAELAEALSAAHAKGIIHRDLKPANVHLVEGHALLADFGVAAMIGAKELTATGAVVGTRRYMAPEQHDGASDPRGDIYGLGATLIEAVTGQEWHQLDERSRGAVPRSLRLVLLRAVDPSLAARWQSAAALAKALRRRRAPGWRQSIVMAGVGGAAMAGIWLGWSRQEMPRPFSADLAITAAGSDDLADRLLRATVVRLEWFPPLQVMPWRTSIATVTPTWRAEGAVEWSRGTPQATVTLRDTAGVVVDMLQIPGDTADLPGWAAAVAAAIVGRTAPEHLHDFRALSGGARVGAAMRLYYEATDAFDRQDWAAAESGYRAALAIDPGFAQAQWGALQARKWARLPHRDELVELAANPELPAPLGELVRLQLETDLHLRIAGLDSLAAAWPGLPAVHLTRANELFHRGPLVGRPLAEGVAAFRTVAERFASLDCPRVWDQVAWGATRLGDEALARHALRARRRRLVGDDVWGPLLRYAVESRFRPWLGRLLGTALRLGGGTARDQVAEVHRLAVTLDLPDVQATLARWIADDPGGTADRTATAWSGQAIAALLQGRPTAALEALDSAAASVPGSTEFQMQQWEWRVLLRHAGFPLDPREEERGRSALTSAAQNELPLTRVAFVQGIVATAAEDTTAARAHRKILDVSTTDLLPAAVIDAHVRPADFDPAVLSRSLARNVTDAQSLARGPWARALAAISDARAATARGDTAGAIKAWGWYENIDLRRWPVGPPQEGEIDAALSGVARWHRGHLLAASGDTVEGCAHIRRVVALWHNAEPAFLRAMDQAASRPWQQWCNP